MPDDPSNTGRGPFANAAQAIAAWLDGAGSEYAARVTTPGSGRKPFAWKLVATADQLGGKPAKLVLPLDFPARPAEVHVDRDLCLVLPHVEESGKVCLGSPSKPGDYESPAHAVADTLRDFEAFLDKCADLAWVKAEFQRERLAYWARYCEAYKRRRGFPAPRAVQAALEPFKGHAEGNLAGYAQGSKGQRSLLWLTTMNGADANVLAYRHNWAKGTLQRGHVLLVEMPEAAKWTPQDWPQTLADLEQQVAEWTDHELSVVSWIRGKKDDQPKPFLIILVQGTVAFGLCLAPPLVPLLTTVGLVPVVIERVDADWALARDHELGIIQPRMKKRVLILGCGSLGAPVAELMARAGVGNMTLVDMEFFEPENTSRHLLGFTAVNNSKAVELASRLRREVPGINVKGHYALASSWLAHGMRKGDFDLVIDCTGESSVRCLLAQLATEHLAGVSIAHLWLEPFCAAAHLVFLQPGDRWPGDDPADTLVNVAGWPDDVRVRLPACSAGFHPYGASDVWQAAGFCVERLLAHVDGDVDTSTVWTWTRGSAYFEYLGVDARPGPLVPKTRTRFESQSLERPFPELIHAQRAA
ncbi:ThiF family adenylyltransferase [Roseateles sp. P5_D6]